MKLSLFARAGLLAAALALAVPAAAQEKTGNKPGFSLKPGTARIVLMRPTIRVGEQSTGGLYEPNADWTNQAREQITIALKELQAGLGNEVVVHEEGIANDPLAAQYGHLFGALADSVIEYQFFRGNRLPTKVRKGSGFDWSLGPDVAKLAAAQGADYALFINTHDAYGSTGRKLLQVAGLLAGVAVTSGVHVGHAGLIDLKTGELVWLNADRQMGGDVRTPEGAQKRVRQLLEGFPGRPAEAAPKAAQ